MNRLTFMNKSGNKVTVVATVNAMVQLPCTIVCLVTMFTSADWLVWLRELASSDSLCEPFHFLSFRFVVIVK